MDRWLVLGHQLRGAAKPERLSQKLGTEDDLGTSPPRGRVYGGGHSYDLRGAAPWAGAEVVPGYGLPTGKATQGVGAPL